jgi:hypothetical protein
MSYVLKYHPMYTTRETYFNVKRIEQLKKLSDDNLHIVVHGAQEAGKRTLVQLALSVHNTTFKDISNDTVVGYSRRNEFMSCIDCDAVSNDLPKTLLTEYTFLKNSISLNNRRKLFVIFGLNNFNQKIISLINKIFKEDIVQFICTTKALSQFPIDIISRFVKFRLPYPSLNEINHFIKSEKIDYIYPNKDPISILSLLISIDSAMYDMVDTTTNWKHLLTLNQSFEKSRESINVIMKNNIQMSDFCQHVISLCAGCSNMNEIIDIIADCEHTSHLGTRKHFHMENLIFRINDVLNFDSKL